MKDAATWTADDLNELITNQAEESISLEFKHGQVLEDLQNRQAADRRKDEISKDVSAFANRMGGVIIYGLEETKQEPHQAKALTPINPAKCSKERLEQIITSRIRPAIQGLMITPIELRPREVVYVVKIPRSHTAHQASDKRYYRRVNFGNEVMEDDEIRQTMNRQTKPTYHVQLQIVLIVPAELRITGTIQNTSAICGNDVSALLLLPSELSQPGTIWGTLSIQDQITSSR
jgi:predicted HTH transcriptional regulator